jgi:hypothetical protein
MDCAEVALSAEAGTDSVTLDLKGTDGVHVRMQLSPAHLSTLHQQIHAVFMARNPKPAGAAAAAGAPAPGSS